MPANRTPTDTGSGSPGSLRAFHVVFVTCACLLTLALGVWGTVSFVARGGASPLIIAVVGWSAGIVLAVYGRWFIHRMRAVSG